MIRYFALLFLAGCVGTSPTLITKQSVVIIPDSKFFICPTISAFPNVDTLTDNQIAELLVQLDTNNKICKHSIDAIKQQLKSAQKRIGNQP